MSGQHRHGWLHVLLCAAILISFIIPAGIQANPDSIPQEAVQLPVSLQTWSHIEALPSTDDLRVFKRGIEYYFNERYAAALEHLPDEQAAEAIAIGDYILFYRAKSNLMLERKKEALNDFRLLGSRYPDSPLSVEALVNQCQILLTMNEANAALAVLDNPIVGTNSETLYYRARALDLTGEKEKAVDLYLRVYSRYPTSKFSPLAEQYLVLLSPGALKGVRNYDARLQRAESLISEGNKKAARTLLLALGKVSATNSKSSEKRSLLFGEVEYQLGRTSAAIPYLRKVTSADAALHAKALYFEGLCLRKLEKEKAFLALRDKALKLYPRSPEAEELCYSAATYFDVKYEKSADAYALLYDAFPQGKYAERALWKLALSSYFEKKYGKAALGFWKYLSVYPSPISAASAMYWMGRCYQKLGDSENAKYLFRRTRALANESFYGERAREAEISLQKEQQASTSGDRPFPAGPGSVKEIDFNQVIAICDGIELQPLTMAEPDSTGAHVIERARQLMAVGFADLALTELRWGTRQYPQDNDSLCYIMARIYASKQDYDAAIACLRKAFPDYNARPLASLPIEIWDILFPIRHWEAISEQAAKVKIDSNLVLAVIRQESAFDEKARSKANARGLMQILPSTGRKLAKQARITRYNAGKLYQAETNIALGTRYLASLLQEYERSELALAAYNAGDSRVDRWLKEWGHLNMAEFVEQIPFSETRGYVRQVLNNQVRYGLLTSSRMSEIR
jgi:soluble lytic murein transglycosylase-like protein/TolA-binding protein